MGSRYQLTSTLDYGKGKLILNLFPNNKHQVIKFHKLQNFVTPKIDQNNVTTVFGKISASEFFWLPAHFGQNNVPAYLGQNSIPAHFGQNNVPAHLGQNNVPAHFGQNNVPVHFGQNNVPAHLGQNNIPAHLGQNNNVYSALRYQLRINCMQYVCTAVNY